MYNIKQGFSNIWKNKMFSLASIATMTACIFLFGLFYIVVENFQYMVKEAESGVAITVFFTDGISEEQIETIREEISVRAEVSDIVYVSPEEAWENFKEDYFEGSEAAAESFADDNPLANSASFEIYMNDISMQDSLVSYIEALDGVSQVNRSDVVANTLSDFNRLLGVISVAIIAVLLCVAIFLINNTITVGISVRSEEIGIMRLIGANNSFIRSPFLIEGSVIGLIGSGIPLIILFLMYGHLDEYVANHFSFLSDKMTFLPASVIFNTLIPVALLLGLGIGFFGSLITVRRHLHV